MSTLVQQQPIAVPAAARPQQAPTRLRAIGRAIWRAFERAGQRRAAHELRQLGLRWEAADPERARYLRAAGRYDTRSVEGPCSR